MKAEPGSPDPFQQRVIKAAQAALEAEGSVGPLELFRNMGMLHDCHIQGWRKGSQFYPNLEASIQIGPEKFQKATRYFAQWVAERGLRPLEVSFTRRTRRGEEPLQVTIDGNPERERFYRTKYAPGNLSERKVEDLRQKLTKAPDLVVFEKVSEDGNCSDCGVALLQGDFLFLEEKQPLCLTCADLDHLVFLPSGDMALTRRCRKHSPLLAVVVRFNRSVNQYQRKGILVTQEAIELAERECTEDAAERAANRSQGAVRRAAEDVEFTRSFTEAISGRFPNCPEKEARAIAQHATVRGSGRVGRCAAARALDVDAIELAVVAYIRHQHTHYDRLLMAGVERHVARSEVRAEIEKVLDRWRNS